MACRSLGEDWGAGKRGRLGNKNFGLGRGASTARVQITTIMEYIVNHQKKRFINKKGLTLIELLVVISIIAVLAVISLVGIPRYRSMARGSVCTSNLRQIGAAMVIYAGDDGGRLPPLEDRTGNNDGLVGIWPQIIAKGGYLPMTSSKSGALGTNAGTWTCPDCVPTQLHIGGYGAAEGTVMKVKRGTAPGSGSVRLAAISNPARTWLVGDALNSNSNLKSCWYAIWANPSQWGSRGPGARHREKVNVCMVDGHVESLTLKQLRDKDYTMRNP